MNRFRRHIAWALILTVITGTIPALHADDAAASRISHVVLCWLKDPGNQDHRQQIIDVSKSFSEIPSVRSVHVGTALSSDRAIVDDSFDVAIYLTFDSKENLQAYLGHPKHVAAKENVLMPLVKKVVVYDFEGTP
jgi:hypothetical protein